MNRVSEFAARRRDAILDIFGNKCQACGAKTQLEFDVIVPDAHAKTHHGNVSWAHRMIYYSRQLMRGNLQVLCSKCNSRKHRGDRRYIIPAAAAPGWESKKNRPELEPF